MFTRRIKLSALDANYTANQSIWIQIKLPSSNQYSNNNNESIQQTVATSPSPKISWLNLVYFVSAINELEIAFSNKSNSHEVSFRNQNNNNIDENIDEEKSATGGEKTLAYLIVEKSKFLSSQDSISIEQEQLLDNTLLENTNSSLFRVNEMRNGLYSIAAPTPIYNLIKGSKNRVNSSLYTLKLTIR